MALSNWMLSTLTIHEKPVKSSITESITWIEYGEYGKDKINGKNGYFAEPFKNHINIYKNRDDVRRMAIDLGSVLLDDAELDIEIRPVHAKGIEYSIFRISHWDFKTNKREHMFGAMGYAFIGKNGEKIGMPRKVKKELIKLILEYRPKIDSSLEPEKIIQWNQGWLSAKFPLGEVHKETELDKIFGGGYKESLWERISNVIFEIRFKIRYTYFTMKDYISLKRKVSKMMRRKKNERQRKRRKAERNSKWNRKAEKRR